WRQAGSGGGKGPPRPTEERPHRLKRFLRGARPLGGNLQSIQRIQRPYGAAQRTQAGYGGQEPARGVGRGPQVGRFDESRLAPWRFSRWCPKRTTRRPYGTVFLLCSRNGKPQGAE